ncbi:hypothetical protein NC652_033726 [Populus alba x Populus x berolinensis]|nr:hypothetical protein NC652_033726 [Populus alba x Populus x berolinensis]
MVGPLKFEGPCTAPVTVKVQGTLKAPSDPRRLRDDWVAFRNVEGLTVSGGGIFDGQGAIAWFPPVLRSPMLDSKVYGAPLQLKWQ